MYKGILQLELWTVLFVKSGIEDLYLHQHVVVVMHMHTSFQFQFYLVYAIVMMIEHLLL